MEDSDEPEIGHSMESFQNFLNSQRDLFSNQIDQLQRLVVAQCKLTGVNPLSQEMAAGALSIKIGKKPRDLLNPKAVSYMQAVFSIKDAITKKECREISAQFGISATLVRDFFNGQRTRMRKFVRLAKERAARVTFNDTLGMSIGSSDSSQVEQKPLEIIPQFLSFPNQENMSITSLNYADDNPVATDSEIFRSLEVSDPFLMNRASSLVSFSPDKVEEEPSYSAENEFFSGLDELDKHFVKNIFHLLRKEESFAGQVKLMEWIMQIQTPSVLDWFLLEGGAMILTTWLGLATSEEQTSIILVILKVFCHLPLQNLLPEHMSAVLQSVNGLRYYRTSDISNRARVLLSKWSKMFSRSQALKKTNGTKSITSAQEMLLKQSIEEIMGDELWQQLDSDHGNMAALSSENSDNIRRTDSSHAVKLLTASSDDQTKKPILGISASNAKKRRKVQLVDHHGTSAVKSAQSTKLTGSMNVSRPMSADDIQKAKIRALYKQNKLGKSALSIDPNFRNLPKLPVRSRIEEHNKSVSGSQNRPDNITTVKDTKQQIDSLQLSELCKKAMVPWQTPPEIWLNDTWRVGCGESGKEADAQKNRNRREMEIFYCTIHDIPLNPREPWDHEMDYDDTLTLEIPVDQQPDGENEDQSLNNDSANVAASLPNPIPNISPGNVSEPDLELLAALLKNPELVIALTSCQTSNLSNDDTVRLLDMIKLKGAGGNAPLNGISGNVETKPDVSLPSPTPSHTPATSGWKPEAVSNPFHKQTPALRSDNILKLPRHHAFHHNNAVTPERQTQQHITTTAVSPAFGLDTLSSNLLAPTPSNFLAGSSQSRRLESIRVGSTPPAAVPLINPSPYHPFSTALQAPSWPAHQQPSAEPLRLPGARGGNLLASNSHLDVNGSPWERPRNVVEDDGFETWSPERSPSGSARRLPRRGHGSGVSQPGWQHIVPNTSSNRARQHHNKNEDMRWR